jgi:hypothetical protein
VWFEFTTLVVIDADSIGSCKLSSQCNFIALIERVQDKYICFARMDFTALWSPFSQNKYIYPALVLLEQWNCIDWIIYNYLWNQRLSPLTLWIRITLRRGVRNTTLCDKVCKWLGACRWFSPGTKVSSINKTDTHDITEILLKVALNR